MPERDFVMPADFVSALQMLAIVVVVMTVYYMLRGDE